MVNAWLCPQCGKTKSFPPDPRVRCFKCTRSALTVFGAEMQEGAGGYRQTAWVCPDCCGRVVLPPEAPSRCLSCRRTLDRVEADAMLVSGGEPVLFVRTLPPS